MVVGRWWMDVGNGKRKTENPGPKTWDLSKRGPGQALDGADVELAGAEGWELLDAEEAVAVGDEQVGQPDRVQGVPQLGRALLQPGVDHDQPLAPLRIRHRDDHDPLHALIVDPDDPGQRLLDQPVRDHLAADLGEAALPADDAD